MAENDGPKLVDLTQEEAKNPKLREEDILVGLNPAQRLAVTCPADVLQILAPPGSGKTKTLTTRVAWLLCVKKIQPWNIIVTTFTVKAAREMKERVGRLIGDGRESKLILGTFHSICLRYLRRYGKFIGLPKNIGVADTSDSTGIIKRAIKVLKCHMEPNSVRNRISGCKARGVDPEEDARTGRNKSEAQDFLRIYREYQAALARSNLLDYDDLLLKTAELLRKHPECVSNVQYLLVDEYQDTSIVQFDLVRLFAQTKRRITIVGDPDQSIYSFRAAEIENLNRMKVQYPDLEMVHLEENYRSAGAILNAAQQVIEQDLGRPKKPLVATHGNGLRPVLRELPSAMEEASWIVKELKRMMALSGNLLCYNDFAILLRTAYLSRLIEAALGKAGVPYRMVGGTRFFDRVEIKVLLDYMRVIDQPDNDEAVKRIINVPSRKIGDTTANRIVEEAANHGISIWAFIRKWTGGQLRPKGNLGGGQRTSVLRFISIITEGRNLVRGNDGSTVSITSLVNYLLKKLEFKEYLQKNYPEKEDWQARWENIEELQVLAKDASTRLMHDDDDPEALPQIDGVEQSNASPNEDALSHFLASITLSSEVRQEEDEDRPDQVTISTIHAAKGLEWGAVFIPGVVAGTIPHSRAENIDEERRLLYVAMTRAKAMLYMSQPGADSRGDVTTPSPFTGSLRLEKVGPTVDYSDVKVMAQILYRDCPAAEDVHKASEELETVEDDVGTRKVERDGYYGRYGSGSRPYGSESSSLSRSAAPVVSSRNNVGFQSAGSLMNTTMASLPNASSYSAAQTTQSGFSKASNRNFTLNNNSRMKRKSPFQAASSQPLKRQKSDSSIEWISPSKIKSSSSSKNPASMRPLDPVLGAHRPRIGAALSNKPVLRVRTDPDMTEEQENQVPPSYIFLSSPPKSSPPHENAIESVDLRDHIVNKNEPVKSDSTQRTALAEATGAVNRLPAPAIGKGKFQKQLGARSSGNGWAERMKRAPSQY